MGSSSESKSSLPTLLQNSLFYNARTIWFYTQPYSLLETWEFTDMAHFVFHHEDTALPALRNLGCYSNICNSKLLNTVLCFCIVGERHSNREFSENKRLGQKWYFNMYATGQPIWTFKNPLPINTSRLCIRVDRYITPIYAYNLSTANERIILK